MGGLSGGVSGGVSSGVSGGVSGVRELSAYCAVLVYLALRCW